MKKKVVAAGVSMCLAAGLLAGCGSSGATETTAAAAGESQAAESSEESKEAAPEGSKEVVFWHSYGGALGDTVQEIVDEYNETQGKEKGIFVNAVYQGYEGTDKLIMAYQTKDTANACDINIGLTSTIPSLLDLDWTVKASDMMKKHPEGIQEDDFYPSLLRSVSYQDEAIALPLSNSTLIMYYNEDALKEAGYSEPPKTLDELVEYTEKLTKKDESGNITQYGFECQVKRYQLVNYIASQSPDAFFGDEEGGRAGAMTKLTCGEDGTLKNFLEKWDKLVQEEGYQPVEGKVAEEFSAGTAAIVLMSSSKCQSVEGLVGDSFKWNTAPIPKVNESDTSGAACGGSCMVLMDRGDEAVTDAAWDFMSYISSQEVQYRISTASGYVPTTMAAEELPEMQSFYSEHPQYKTALDVIKTSSPMAQEPMDLCYNEINEKITDIMTQFTSGELSVDETEEKIVSECDALLDEWHEAND